MSEAEEVVKFNLKAVINKEKTRVLFAEVDNDFVNLLFSFLILPLGTVLQVLQKHYGDKAPRVIGSLNTLYNGLANLGCSELSVLYGYRPAILSTGNAYAFPYLSMKFSTNNSCFTLEKAYFVVYKVLTEDKASFIISDDLWLVPSVNESFVQTLKSVGVDIVDMDGSATRDVIFGLNEVMDFLLGSLISHQPLTDIVLGKRVKYELQSCKIGIPLPQIQTEATPNPEKMVLKALFQKSTKKFLLVQAEEDFVSFLFCVLRMPLGLVDLHLGGNSSFTNLDNLYKSIIDQLDHQVIRRGYVKQQLMEADTFSYNNLCMAIDVVLITYRSRMYIVTDDLTVTLLNVTSVISRLGEMKISPSDVEEVEFHIGLEEARNVFEASLTSSCALSDGLISPLLKKQLIKPKQEH